MIAERIIAAREAGWQDADERRAARRPHARLRPPRRRDARQRGELPHQEELHRDGRGADREPGAHMTLQHRPRSGDLARARRRHHVPAGPPERRLHLDPGLLDGRGAPGRLPLGDEGAGARRDDHPRRPALRAHERASRTCTCRSGPASDIAFLGGLIRHVIETRVVLQGVRRPLHERLDAHQRGLPDTEDLDGVFAGFDPETGHLRPRLVGVRGRRGRGGGRRARARDPGVQRPHRARAWMTEARSSATRRCSTRAASSRSSGATSPATRRRWSSASAASRRELFRDVADALIANSGRERTTLLAYAVGWTQHSTGVQMIRAGAILQLLLGNIGRPGGGIMAMRGHATIQGSSDIPTLYDLLPGYLHMPRAREGAPDARGLLHDRRRRPRLVVALRQLHRLAAEGLVRRRRRRPTNDYGFRHLPKISGNHSHFPTMLRDARRRDRRHVRAWARTRPSGRSTPGSCAARWPSSSGSWSATSPRSRRRASGTTRPRCARASCARRTSRPRSS